KRRLALAEDDRHRHHDGAAKAPDRTGAKVRVIVDPGRDLWVSQLHEQRAAAAQQQDVLAIDATGYRIVFVESWSHASGSGLVHLNIERVAIFLVVVLDRARGAGEVDGI